MILMPRLLDAEGFAPFGTLAHLPAPGARADVGPAQNLRDGVAPCLRWAVARRTPLPLRVTTMERHRYSSQSFIPLTGARWLVLVAPKNAADGPDMARAMAFCLDGTQAITYAPDVWHHPLTALDDGAGFAVLTFLDGSGNDDEFIAIADGITVEVLA